MTWGIENNVIERFFAAGIPAGNIAFAQDTFTFNYPGAPSALLQEFRAYYGPTMSAFEAAEKNGRASDLQKELEELFNRQNKSGDGTYGVPRWRDQRTCLVPVISPLAPSRRMAKRFRVS